MLSFLQKYKNKNGSPLVSKNTIRVRQPIQLIMLLVFEAFLRYNFKDLATIGRCEERLCLLRLVLLVYRLSH